MEPAVFGRCVFKDKTVSIPLQSDSTLMFLCSNICSRFNELEVGAFEMSYLVPDHPPCVLETDLDVRVMYLSLMNEEKYTVTITIAIKEFLFPEKQNGVDDVFCGDGNMHNAEDDFIGKYAAPSGHTYLSQAWKSYINHVGQKFIGGVIEFREKLCKYAIEKGFKVRYLKNEKERVTAQCSKKVSDGCRWRVHASLCPANGFFYIRSLNNEHTCKGRIRERTSSMMSSKIVSSVLVDQIQSTPLIKPIEIVKDFKKNYGLDISYHNAWYGKELAKKRVHGDESLSYKHLAWYVGAVLSSNPGSRCILECDPESSRFKRFFISFHACIEGFRFCRPLLFLDGTFIKNKYKGHLLAATGKNGNQGMYPLAFAVVDSENEENWTWFLQNLAEIVNPQGRTIAFISDRNKGLLEALPFVFPHSLHAFCFHHLKHNVLARYPSSLGKTYRDWIVHLFGKCAYAPTEDAFEMHMRTLKEEGGAVIREFLKNLPKENWSAAYFPGKKYGEMCSNVAESFNAWIVDQRHLPIYQLIDGIRIKIMEMIAQRRRIAEEWNTCLCPEMETRLEELLDNGRHWDVVVLCYDIPILPIPDIDRHAQEDLGESFVNLPLTKKPPGRPKVKRIKSLGEQFRPVTCSRCRRLGRHTKRTCTAQI
ncbi:unnamed protein product [Prunus armeniaca]